MVYVNNAVNCSTVSHWAQQLSGISEYANIHDLLHSGRQHSAQISLIREWVRKLGV